MTSSAFDLNTIPLPAVDHVDIRGTRGPCAWARMRLAAIDIVTRRDLKSEVRSFAGSR